MLSILPTILPTILLSLFAIPIVLAQPTSSTPGVVTPPAIFTTSTLPAIVLNPGESFNLDLSPYKTTADDSDSDEAVPSYVATVEPRQSYTFVSFKSDFSCVFGSAPSGDAWTTDDYLTTVKITGVDEPGIQDVLSFVIVVNPPSLAIPTATVHSPSSEPPSGSPATAGTKSSPLGSDVKLAIAAIVLSSATFLSLVACLLILLYRRRRRSSVALDGTANAHADPEIGDPTRSEPGRVRSTLAEHVHSSLHTESHVPSRTVSSQHSFETQSEPDGEATSEGHPRSTTSDESSSLASHPPFANVTEILDHYLPLNRRDDLSTGPTRDYQRSSDVYGKINDALENLVGAELTRTSRHDDSDEFEEVDLNSSVEQSNGSRSSPLAEGAGHRRPWLVGG
jgi:hypothetical protein